MWLASSRTAKMQATAESGIIYCCILYLRINKRWVAGVEVLRAPRNRSVWELTSFPSGLSIRVKDDPGHSPHHGN